MQGTAPTAPHKRFPFNRRTLLVGGLLGVALVLGVYFVVHASGPSRHKPHIGHSRSTAHHKHAATKSCRTHGRRCAVHRKASHVRRRPHHRPPPHATRRRISQLGMYARALIPVVDRSRGAFDGAAASVQSSSDPTATGATCANLSQELMILEQQADGVPHPYSSDPRVEQLHLNMLGVYHDMLGALVACNTASDNEDDGALQTAIGDIVSEDEAMRALDDHVHAVAGH